MRCLPRGNEAENDAGRERKKKSKTEHHSIQLNRADARNILRHRCDEGFRPPLRDEQPEHPAEPGQKHAFREQLPNDPSAAGAERRAQRNLFSAHRRARQHEIGDICVRDQQQTSNRAKQNVERGPDVSHHFIAERLRSGAPFCIGFRILFFQRRRDRPQLRVRLGQRHARFDPARFPAADDSPRCCVLGVLPSGVDASSAIVM